MMYQLMNNIKPKVMFDENNASRVYFKNIKGMQIETTYSFNIGSLENDETVITMQFDDGSELRADLINKAWKV